MESLRVASFSSLCHRLLLPHFWASKWASASDGLLLSGTTGDKQCLVGPIWPQKGTAKWTPLSASLRLVRPLRVPKRFGGDLSYLESRKRVAALNSGRSVRKKACVKIVIFLFIFFFSFKGHWHGILKWPDMFVFYSRGVDSRNNILCSNKKWV